MQSATPALPATFFCERQAMTLSEKGCVRLWKSARERRPDAWEGRHNCLNCPIGAANAGVSAPEASAARASEALRMICPRCTRPAGRLVNAELCVSCYNRKREIARGRNCKGNPPIVLQSRLRDVTLCVSHDGTPAPAVEMFPAVMSLAEAMILAAKRANGPVTFSLPAPAAELLA